MKSALLKKNLRSLPTLSKPAPTFPNSKFTGRALLTSLPAEAKATMTRVNIRQYLHFREEDEGLCREEKRLTHDEKDELLEAFTLYDKDRDGLLDTKDLGTVFRSLGQLLTLCEETDLVAQFAQKKCDEIDFRTFYKIFRERRKKFNEDDELRESFRRFDKEDNGYMCISELRSMLLTMGEPLTKEEVEDWLRDGEEFTKDGKLYYEDFATYMLSR